MSTFSVIIPWKDRPEIKHTLRANAELFARHEAEVIIANCGGNPAELAALIEAHQRSCSGSATRQVACAAPAFNRSLANNLGASVSVGSWLLFLDADYVLRSDIFAEARPFLEARRSFVNIRRVLESEPRPNPKLSFLKEEVNSRELICLDGRRAVLHAVSGGDGSAWGPGQLLINRDHFIAVGGYNSALTGWGFEDTDVLFRLQFELRLSPVIAGEAMHLSHGDRTRALKNGSRFDDSRANLEICLENYKTGHHLGSYWDDLRTWGDHLQVSVERPRDLADYSGGVDDPSTPDLPFGRT